MHIHPSLERAKAYLDVHISRDRPLAAGMHRPGDGPYVTLSRECGAGAATLAGRLAERLNTGKGEGRWTVFDQQIVELVLQDEHLSTSLARFLPEDRISEITGSVGEIVGLHPNLWELVQKTNRLLRKLAEKGHVILVGRGANFAVAGVSNGLHVRLVAPEANRIERIMEARLVGLEKARTIVRKTDAARAHYVSAVFDTDVKEETAYDLVINTGRMSESMVIDVIVHALEPHIAARAAANGI